MTEIILTAAAAAGEYQSDRYRDTHRQTKTGIERGTSGHERTGLVLL